MSTATIIPFPPHRITHGHPHARYVRLSFEAVAQINDALIDMEDLGCHISEAPGLSKPLRKKLIARARRIEIAIDRALNRLEALP